MTDSKKTTAGKIVISNANVLIRYPLESDATAMRDYINALSSEKTFIRLQGEQTSLEEEERFLSDHLKKIAEGKAVQLLVFNQDKLIGIAGIEMQTKTEEHVGVLDIAIAKEFRGQGFGKLMMKAVMEEAIKCLPSLKIITLTVLSINTVAIHLYQQLDFQEWGRLPKGIKHAGQYVDSVQMYKTIS